MSESEKAENEKAKKAKKEKKAKPDKVTKWFRFMHRWHHILYKPIWPFKKHGHKAYYDEGPLLLVGNHKSMLDTVTVACATHRAVHYLAKKELWDSRMGAWIANKCGAIPVAKDGGDVKAVMSAMRYLKNGEVVGIFPEGTRNKTEDQLLLPFKSGAAAIAIKSKVPIVCVVCLTKIRPFHVTHVWYDEPFEFSEYYDKRLTQEDYDRCDEILKDRITELYYKLDDEVNGKKRRKKELKMAKKSKNAQDSFAVERTAKKKKDKKAPTKVEEVNSEEDFMDYARVNERNYKSFEKDSDAQKSDGEKTETDDDDYASVNETNYKDFEND